VIHGKEQDVITIVYVLFDCYLLGFFVSYRSLGVELTAADTNLDPVALIPGYDAPKRKASRDDGGRSPIWWCGRHGDRWTLQSAATAGFSMSVSSG
jgi:hypothetical protein